MATQTPERLDSFLAGLTQTERTALYYDWPFYARPKQLPPPGDWSTWLLLAGRGFGKTRTGAEFIRTEVKAGRASRIALIERTPADARDVMIEGESGLLAVHPLHERPVYEASRRRVRWANGATATIYTSYEPDQLRGPQHDLAWAEELCCAEGTMIATSVGPKPIQQIQPGDLVYTRRCLRPVLTAKATGVKPVFFLETEDGKRLVATAGHPVYVQDKGFVPLTALKPGDIIQTWDNLLPQVLSGLDGVGGSKPPTTWTAKVACCIGPFIRRGMDQFRKAPRFITATATRRIMTLLIWWPSRVPCMSANTEREDGPHSLKMSDQSMQACSGNSGSPGRLPVAIVATSLSPGPPMPFTVRPIVGQDSTENRTGMGRTVHADNVGQYSYRPAIHHSNFAHATVLAGTPASTDLTPCAEQPKNAPYARNRLSRLILARRHAPANAAKFIGGRIKRIGPLKYPQRVFNLEVAGEHEYFASGVLTHNCSWQYQQETWDNLMLGLRLGQHPRAVVSTTPKPGQLLKSIMAQPTTATVRGSTYENLANLAPTFRAHVLSRYEGTSLGRQELHGEILDEADDSLWKRSLIDKTRVEKAPELTRIVVGVDPPGGATECGIVIAGRDRRGEFYVISDRSLRGSPNTWAAAVISAYITHQADRVIGEANYGGDMVEETIRNAAKAAHVNIGYRNVSATRGKAVRAEPIVGLYEQGKVHHVGTFSAMEAEMCLWVPGETKESPNRLDALVWALTELSGGSSWVPIG